MIGLGSNKDRQPRFWPDGICVKAICLFPQKSRPTFRRSYYPRLLSIISTTKLRHCITEAGWRSWCKSVHSSLLAFCGCWLHWEKGPSLRWNFSWNWWRWYVIHLPGSYVIFQCIYPFQHQTHQFLKSVFRWPWKKLIGNILHFFLFVIINMEVFELLFESLFRLWWPGGIRGSRTSRFS